MNVAAMQTADAPVTALGGPDDEPEPALRPGSMLGAWRVLGVLGEGGMGRVYLAEHSGIGRKAAIKVLRRSLVHSASVARFFDEARAVNRIRHEGIVDVTDLFEADGRPCIVMELLSGQTLGARLQQGPLPVALTVEVGVAVAEALAAAHAVAVVHRDLKPDNVMLVSTSPLRVKVVDFGVAKLGFNLRERGVTSVGAIVGTPEFMAPEQLAGTAVDHRVDIYALGLLLFQMLAGQQPFRGHSFGDWVVQHMTVPPPDLRALAPDVPAPLAALIARMLEKDRDRRPATMQEVAATLRDIAAGPVVQPLARPETREVVAAAAPPARLAVVGAAVVAAIGIALLILQPWAMPAVSAAGSASTITAPAAAAAIATVDAIEAAPAPAAVVAATPTATSPVAVVPAPASSPPPDGVAPKKPRAAARPTTASTTPPTRPAASTAPVPTPTGAATTSAPKTPPAKDDVVDPFAEGP